MNLQAALDALTEDLDPAAKAKLQLAVLSAVGSFRQATKGKDVERLVQLFGARAGIVLADRWMFRRLMTRAGFPQYAKLGPVIGLGAEIAGRSFERGRATQRKLRAEEEAAGSTHGIPPRKTAPPAL